MTIPEILHLINGVIPSNLVQLANHLASLDNQTALEIIEKYNADIKMSQKQLSEEIQKQTWRKINEF